MPDTTAILRSVRSLFQQVGEADVMPFIQGTAFLLLLIYLGEYDDLEADWRFKHLGGFDPDTGKYLGPTTQLSDARQEIGKYLCPDDVKQRELVPLPPIRLQGDRVSEALGLLYTLCNSQQNATGGELSPADVFNHHLLTGFIDSMLPGGRYPTPRNIAAHMARVLSPPAEAKVADLTCGSGSLLTAVNHICANPYLTGFEISGDWARLAWTNAILHGVDTTRLAILPRNSLQGVSAPDESDCYDVVVMNPPFGNREDPALVRQALGTDSSGTSSEVIFPNLAIRRLQAGGIAMVLAPAGVLFRRSTAERELRRQLLEERMLYAVIAYPEDAFQPYSGLETHGLLFRKKTPPANHPTWLFVLNKDGRTGVKNRRDDPRASNQLNLAEAVLLGRGETVASIASASSTAAAEAYWFSTEEIGEAAGPGRLVAGYWITKRTTDFLMRRYVVCANDASQARAHWITWEQEAEDAKQAGYLILQQSDDGRFDRAWQPVADSTLQIAIRWEEVAEADLSEDYWTLKLDDEGDEQSSWLRLYMPNEDGEWRLDENKDDAQPIMTLEEETEAATNIILVVDGQGKPVASLATEDAEKLDSKEAVVIRAVDGSAVGHLWSLDRRLGDEEEGEREHRGYLFLLKKPAPDFHQYESGELQALVAELGTSRTHQAGLLIGKLTSDGAIADLDVWLATDREWRATRQRTAHGLCFDTEGLVLGLALSRTSLQTSDSTATQPNYDLQPTTYLPRIAAARPPASSAYILGQIKRNQHQLSKHVDFLLGIVEAPPIASQEIPPQLHDLDVPVEWLSPDQISVWQSILAYSQETDAASGQPKTIFRAEDLFSEEDQPSMDQIDQSLQLFAAMGAIIPVIVRDELFYRRVTKLDVVSSQEQNST